MLHRILPIIVLLLFILDIFLVLGFSGNGFLADFVKTLPLPA